MIEMSYDLTNLPSYLASSLSTSLFAGQILMSIIFTMLFLVPILILTRGRNAMLLTIVGFCLLGFEVAIGWLPTYFLIMISLAMALLLAMKAKDVITG